MLQNFKIINKSISPSQKYTLDNVKLHVWMLHHPKNMCIMKINEDYVKCANP